MLANHSTGIDLLKSLSKIVPIVLNEHITLFVLPAKEGQHWVGRHQVHYYRLHHSPVVLIQLVTVNIVLVRVLN